MEEHCKQCGRKLVSDELGLNRKIFTRNAAEFLCLTCMAAHFKVRESNLEQLIANYKEIGCRLFV